MNEVQLFVEDIMGKLTGKKSKIPKEAFVKLYS